ncbi:MAG: hypothetical protein AAGD43_02015 [Pseudomonadota bacterium]
MSYPTHILTSNEYQQVKDLIVGLADRAATHSGDAFRTVREELMEMITSDCQFMISPRLENSYFREVDFADGRIFRQNGSQPPLSLGQPTSEE